jgi:hypothetical protein
MNNDILLDIPLGEPKEIKQCRICFENEEDTTDEMINPCLCRGDRKYVHRRCLNQWRNLSTNPIALNQCTECHYEYQFTLTEYNEKPICAKLGNFMANNTLIFFLLNNGVIIIMSYILEKMDKDRKLRNVINTNDTIGYYTWSLFFYSFFIILILIIAFLFVKNKTLYYNYYKEYTNYNKIALIVFTIFVTYFIDIILTSLIITITIQVFLKLHFMVLNKINISNGQRISNYNVDL